MNHDVPNPLEQMGTEPFTRPSYSREIPRGFLRGGTRSKAVPSRMSPLVAGGAPGVAAFAVNEVFVNCTIARVLFRVCGGKKVAMRRGKTELVPSPGTSLYQPHLTLTMVQMCSICYKLIFMQTSRCFIQNNRSKTFS